MRVVGWLVCYGNVTRSVCRPTDLGGLEWQLYLSCLRGSLYGEKYQELHGRQANMHIRRAGRIAYLIKNPARNLMVRHGASQDRRL